MIFLEMVAEVEFEKEWFRRYPRFETYVTTETPLEN